MKKIILILFVTLLSVCSFGQEFLGIKVDGDKKSVVDKFIEKGFKIKNVKGGSDNVTSLEGSYGGNFYEINVVNTPITKKVWKFAVYLPEQTSWYSLKGVYEKYLKVLEDKYGSPSKSYNFFSSPYYEGDGYEMSAIRIEKCNYFAYWEELPTQISIEISKFKQVRISYENVVNSALDDKEKAKINSNVF